MSMIFAAGVSGQAPDQALKLGPGPHLFLDDYLIAEQSHLTRVVKHPERLPEPVVTGKEDKCFQPYVTVVRDPATKRFRMWYGVPEDASQSHLAYMESEDGIRWIRPHRVLKDPDHVQFGMSIIDEGPGYADKDRRYKWGWWDAGGLKVASSPDGLEWKMLSPGVVLQHNHDINSIFWDPIRKRYIAFGSTYQEGPGWTGKRRYPLTSVSDDLVHWKDPWPATQPDDKDQGETQFYCISGMIARGGLLIALVKVLRDDLPCNPDGPVQGIGYTTLAWSRDGEHWQRDREPFFDRSLTPGSWDHAMAWMDCQLPVGEQVYMYYGGYARGHKVERFTERQIGLAKMLRDRYVSRCAGDEKGYIRTHPVILDGRSMTLNVDAEGGMARVQVLGSDGKPIKGFSFSDCEKITSDSVAAPAKWKRSLSELSEQTVVLELALKNADLYAFELK